MGDEEGDRNHHGFSSPSCLQRSNRNLTTGGSLILTPQNKKEEMKQKLIWMIAFVVVAGTTEAQPVSAAVAVDKYSEKQKRLLAVMTAQLTNLLTQNRLDADSIQAYACRITGLSFFVPYATDFPDYGSELPSLIDLGRVSQAIGRSAKMSGGKQLATMLGLAIYYLHQPGTRPADLDKASRFLDSAFQQSRILGSDKWENECLFLKADLLAQLGKAQESQNLLGQLAIVGENEGNKAKTARAWLQLANLLPSNSPTKHSLYKKSRDVFHLLGEREREIELLCLMSDCDRFTDQPAMEVELEQALALMQTDRFYHTLYVDRELCANLVGRGKYLEGLNYAEKALENMEWSRIRAVKGAFYYKLGATLEVLGKSDEALAWFRKALDSGTADSHPFWYKSLLFATTLLDNTNRSRESIRLLDSVIRRFPPKTIWERLQILSTKGMSYANIKEPTLADENFLALFDVAEKEPSADPLGEMERTYLEIANFYIGQGELKKARRSYKLAIIHHQDYSTVNAVQYSMLYKIDSAEGKFRSAVHNYLSYERADDSGTKMDQRKKLDDITIQHLAEKKDEDIKLLTQEQATQKSELRQKTIRRNILVAGALMLLLIGVLVFRGIKLKQKTSRAAAMKNQELQRLIAEKEWLVKEVHHRVKNNLQTVICLLESQARQVEHNASQAIEITRDRIYAMSLIHQHAYQANDTELVDMSAHLAEFIRHQNAELEDRGAFGFQLDVQSIKLTIAQAIPLALIINEAVSNAIKHAYPVNLTGQITIELRASGDTVILRVTDEGVGIDQNLLDKPRSSSGLDLIRQFSDEIDGQLQILSEQGTSVVVAFSALNQGLTIQHRIPHMTISQPSLVS